MEDRMNRKTGKTGRFIGWLVSAVLIAVLAVGFVGMYHRMTQEARTVYSDVIQEKKQERLSSYVREIYPLIDGMYVEWYIKTKMSAKSLGEILLGAPDQAYAENERHLNWYELRCENLSDWYKNDYPKELEESGVRFYIYSGTADNGYGNFNPLETASHPMFLKFEFDKFGIPRLLESKGMEDANYQLLNGYEVRQRGNSWYDFDTGETVEYGILSGVTVIIACENEVYEAMMRDISVNHWVIYDAIEAMWTDYILFVLAMAVIVLLLGLILPAIRPLGLQEGWKAHIPLELLAAVGFFLVALVLNILPEFVVKSQMEMEYPGLLVYWVGIMQDIMADGRAEFFILAANGVIWFALFFAAYLCVINVRQLFVKGIVRFFKENTLIGRIFCLLFNWVKKAVEFCGTIDFSNKGNRNFFLAVVLNFAAPGLSEYSSQSRIPCFCSGCSRSGGTKSVPTIW